MMQVSTYPPPIVEEENVCESRYQLVSLDTESGKDPLVINETLLEELTSQASSQHHIPVISFVGTSGVGKTTLVTKLVSDDVDIINDWPSVQSPNQLEPETCGLHVYPGRGLSASGSSGLIPRTILIDTEGLGGQLPRAVNKRLREDILMPHWLHSIVTEHSSKRRNLTQKVLPSLAFLLSDILVFVHQNPTHDTITLSAIVEIAKAANQDTERAWKPALVIVQNKHIAVPSNDYTTDITEGFCRDIWEASNLQNLFCKVKVLRVPNFNQKELHERAITDLRIHLSHLCNEVAVFRKDVSILGPGMPMFFSEVVFWELCQRLLHVANREIRTTEYRQSLRGIGDNLLTLSSQRLRSLKTKDAFFDRFFAEIRSYISDQLPYNNEGVVQYRKKYPSMGKVALHCFARSVAFELCVNAQLTAFAEEDVLKAVEQDILESIETAIRVVHSCRPCMANSPLSQGTSLPCTLTDGEHGDFHENPEATIPQSSGKGCISVFVKMQNTWEGEIEGVLSLPSLREYLDDIRETVRGKCVREIAKSQAKALREFFGPTVLRNTSVCCICLGRNVDVFLPCGHAVCSADHRLKSLSMSKVFVCPFPHDTGVDVTKRLSVSDSIITNKSELDNVGIRVLSLDGGGVLGLVQITVLLHIRTLVSAFAPSIEIHEFFDLIIGTSIGSLIGTTTGLLRKSPAYMREMVLRKVNGMFQKVGWRRFSGATLAMLSGNKFSSKSVMSMLYEEFGDLSLNGDDLSEEHKERRRFTSSTQSTVFTGQPLSLGSHRTSSNSPRANVGQSRMRMPVVAVVVYDINEQQVVTFANHNCPYRAKDVVAASMAAPTYFPPVKLSSNDEEHTYIDGAIGANCPAVEGKKLAKELWPDKPIDMMLSLACRGRPPGAVSKPTDWTLSSITSSVIYYVSRTEQIWDEMEKDNDCFVRISPTTEKRIHDWPMDNPDLLTLQTVIDEWIEKPEVQGQLRHVTCMLSAKFFYLGSFTPDPARWRPGQNCRVGIHQRKARYKLKETDFRVAVTMGSSEVLGSVQSDTTKDCGFFVEFVCPRRDFTLSVKLCILGAEVDVSGSPFVFNVR